MALVGPPNAGKSSLHTRLTGSHAKVAPYPYTTKTPLPGMLPYGGIDFQLVDLPPLSEEFTEPWYVNALRPADAAEQVVAIRDWLDQKKVALDERWPGAAAGDAAAGVGRGEDAEQAEEDADEVPDPFRIYLPTLLVANKSDLEPDPDDVRVLGDLLGVRFPAVAVSAETGAGLSEIGPLLFDGLGIVRVYTKVPGRPADKKRPYAVRRGDTVLDVARLVHKEIAESLKFARVWGSGQFDGQQVGADHPMADEDIVELHG